MQFKKTLISLEKHMQAWNSEGQAQHCRAQLQKSLSYSYLTGVLKAAQHYWVVPWTWLYYWEDTDTYQPLSRFIFFALASHKPCMVFIHFHISKEKIFSKATARTKENKTENDENSLVVNKCSQARDNRQGHVSVTFIPQAKPVASSIVFKFAWAPSGHKVKQLTNTTHKLL